MNKLGIRNQIKGLLNRNDVTNAQIDVFIDQAVARIQRQLRVPAMEKAEVYITNAIGGNLLALPSDFLQLKHLYTSKGVIAYADLGTFIKTQDAPGSVPTIYTRVQDFLQVKPTPPEDFEITMVYYGEIPDLVNDTDSSWLTELAPDLLVYGALTFAADFFVDDRKAAFEEIAQRIFGEIQTQAIEMEFAQEGMAVQSAFNSPEY